MFETLACHGTGFESRIIEDMSRGGRSHIRKRFLRDFTGLDAFGNPVTIAAGQCVEAWDDGVRCQTSDGQPVLWDTGYDKGTIIEVFSAREPITDAEFEVAARFLCRQIGKPYDKAGCDRFIPGAQHLIAAPDPGLGLWNYDRWFCSALDAASWELMGKPLFNSKRPYEISPEWTVESLRFNETPVRLVVGERQSLVTSAATSH